MACLSLSSFPSSSTCTSSSSSSSSSFSSSFSIAAVIFLLAILAALVIACAAVGGTGTVGGLAHKEHQSGELSQSHCPRGLNSLSAGLAARKALVSFDKRGDEEEEEEEEEEQRSVLESGLGIRLTAHDNHSDEGRRRIEQEGPASQFPWLLFNDSLLTLHGNILPKSSYYEKRYIRSLLLSPDGNTIFFAHDKYKADSQIGKAIRLPSKLSAFPPASPTSLASEPSSSPPTDTLLSYQVADNIFNHSFDVSRENNFRVTGLEILEGDLTLLYGHFSTAGIFQVVVENGREEEFIHSSPAPRFGMVRHPKEPRLFVGDPPRLASMPLVQGVSADNVSTVAGGAVEGKRDGIGAMARFGDESPRINPRSISRDGSVLYVADRANLRVRRFNTTTNELQTLRFTNGTEVEMGFGPLSTVITSDDCNLFTTGWPISDNPTGNPSLVRWLALASPHGDVSWMANIIVFNHPLPSPPLDPEWTGVNEPSRLLLSHYDSDLYVGTSNGEIFHFGINRSSLHKCGPFDPASPPGFGPFPPYVRPPPVPKPPPSSPSHAGDSKLKLTVVLSATTVALLGLAATLLLWWTGRLCFRSKRGSLASRGGGEPGGSADHLLKTQTRCLLGRSSGFLGQRKTVLAGGQGDTTSTYADSKTTSSSTTTTTTTLSSLLFGGQLGLTSISRELDHLDAPRRIPFADLREATNGFGDTHKVVGARGGFGDLYRAALRVGGGGSDRGGGETVDVALKVMRGALDEMKSKQFISEVTTLSRARHIHLCKLLGYCVEGNVVVLVYPFISGGSLHDRLHPSLHPSPPTPRPPPPPPPPPPPSPPPAPLDWRSRLAVALQIGTALRYLHEELDPPLLHRDVKSSNVLVEGSGEQVKAYLTDFGLARLGNPSAGLERRRETVQTDYRAGTIGYMAPEYAIGLKLTAKNDVYAFGVILLELVTGKSALFWNSSRDKLENDHLDMYDEDLSYSDSETELEAGQQPVLLVHWTRKRFERVGNWDYRLLSKMVDPQLVQSFQVPGGSNWEREMLCAVAKLGQVCTDADANKRPKMGVVVERIKAIVQEGERR